MLLDGEPRKSMPRNESDLKSEGVERDKFCGIDCFSGAIISNSRGMG